MANKLKNFAASLDENSKPDKNGQSLKALTLGYWKRVVLNLSKR